MTQFTLDRIWQTLDAIKDPEIPVVSLVEMGIARDVQLDGDRVVVTITPTFAGCPAMHYMREQIVGRLHALGVDNVEVRTSLNPPWTSEWLSAGTRAKLKQFGMAPPPRLADSSARSGDLVMALAEVVECPYCGSTDTVMDTPFGSTLCRSLHSCNACRQSFDRFKPL